jgi:hypothetical protein
MSIRALRWARPIAGAVALLLGVVTLAFAHDMFAKPGRYFVGANETVLVRIVNGTFTRSENAIARPRVADISVVSPTGRATLDTTAWTATGDTSTFSFRTAGEGTYVAGASTRPSIIALKATEFNQYLRDDGIPDVLAARRRDGELQRAVRERYHKHIKALVQAGRMRSDNYAVALGYPAEIIPLVNPYTLAEGDMFRFRTLVDGRPARNQYVLYGGRTLNGARIPQRSVRSDSAGIARIRIGSRGTWYVKFIHMTRLRQDGEADYESKWGTVTFQVR